MGKILHFLFHMEATFASLFLPVPSHSKESLSFVIFELSSKPGSISGSSDSFHWSVCLFPWTTIDLIIMLNNALWIYKERLPLFFTFFTSVLAIDDFIILYGIQDHFIHL